LLGAVNLRFYSTLRLVSLELLRVVCVLLQVHDIPHQENHCDCGLFTCCYAECFLEHTPKQIHWMRASRSHRGPSATFIMDFGQELQPHPQSRSPHPKFLSLLWFRDTNPRALRHELMAHLLRKMREHELKRLKYDAFTMPMEHSLRIKRVSPTRTARRVLPFSPSLR
jgi:Ulp1 protease family, C-terminal catalytic domain